jgi:hypothetical protein
MHNCFWIIPLSIVGHFGLSAQTTCINDIGLHISPKPLPIIEKKSDSLSTLHIAMSTFSKINNNTPQVITPLMPSASSRLGVTVSLMFSANSLPFFCKIEHTMAKGQKLPLKFRLGSVDYVDEMEGKRIKPK